MHPSAQISTGEPRIRVKGLGKRYGTLEVFRDINFEVLNGMVTIKGEVRNADEKARVGDIARAAPGVKDIANGLEIHPEQ